MCTITLVVTDCKTNNKYTYTHTFKDLESAKLYRKNFSESVKGHAKIKAHYQL